MVTAYTEHNHVIRARDSGINEYLAKPLSARLIYSRICSLVEDQRPFIHCQDFFGPDRRRRRIEHGGPDRRGHKNAKNANRRTKDVPFGHLECRQGRPGFEAPETRQSKRLGEETQEQKLVMKGINDLIPADGKDVTIPVILPKDIFEMFRDSVLYQSLLGVSSTTEEGAGNRKAQGNSLSDAVSRLINENLRMLEESDPKPKTKPTPSGDGNSRQSTVRMNVKVSKETMELMRDIVRARVGMGSPSSPGTSGVKKGIQHYLSEIIAELFEKNRGKFQVQAAALLGSKIKKGL